MKEISFVIGLKIDSQDRLNNLKISIDNLKYNFPDSTVIVSELDNFSKIGEISGIKHVFIKTDNFFNRQKAVNYGVLNCNTPVIVHYDADIILNKKNIEKCANLILDDKIDLIYPHNGYMYDVPKEYHTYIYKDKNLNRISIEKCKLMSNRNVGGAVFFNRDVFWKGGGANEKIIGLGYEDNEIFERYKKLGYRLGKINSPIFHMSHERKETSFDYNPYNQQNLKELMRIINMSKHELLEEIKNWNYDIKN